VEVNTIINLDTKQSIAITAILAFASLFVSLKKYNVMPVAIMFSKSNLMNKTIHLLFFMKQSIINNTLLLLFNLVVLIGLIAVEHFIYVPAMTVLSLLCSFFLMNIKNRLTDKRISKEKIGRIYISPLVKSAVYDYLTPDFFQSAVIAVSLFGVILFGSLKEENILRDTGNLFVVFMGLASALSFGFLSFVESTPHINWKYYAIISPYKFRCHFIHALLFLTGFFGLFIMAFIAAASFVDVMIMFKYLYCMIIMMLLSASIAFTTGSILIKGSTLIIAAILTMWISVLYPRLLPALIILVLIVFLKARGEYEEWYLL
jgi:hypothetical protein